MLDGNERCIHSGFDTARFNTSQSTNPIKLRMKLHQHLKQIFETVKVFAFVYPLWNCYFKKKQTSSRSKLNEPHYELISNWGVIINDLCMTTSREKKRIKWLYWNLFGNLWKCLLKLNLTYSNQLDVKLTFFMTSFIKQWRNIDTHKFDWKIH